MEERPRAQGGPEGVRRWREKATARAERFSGQKAYIKTENDRREVIAARSAEVDFGNLDEAIRDEQLEGQQAD